MIKKIKFELIIITILISIIFISSNIDRILYKNFLTINNVYYKNFFINITEIGNSFWFFCILTILFFVCIFFKKKLKKIGAYYFIKNSSFFLFFSLLLTGLLTQLIKHVFGRPRPNQAVLQNNYELSFFNLESSFHSFPSGHSSTIFAVALLMGLLTPNIKYFYILAASLIAFSRVVVGAHFLTDILGGIVVAFIGFKITLYLFENFFKITNFNPINKINSSLLILSLVIFFISITLVTVGSSVDIFISSLFYKGHQTFVLQSYYLTSILARKFFLPFIILYILVLPFLSSHISLKKIFFNYVFSYKEVFFIFCSLFFNLLVFVNLILKNLWGRARPNDILALGGEENFTAWYEFSKACSSNCSFVSGDASVGFSIIILYFITKNKFYFYASLFAGFLLGIIRILEGGHFLSDILIAGFLIIVLSYVEFYFYKKLTNNEI